VQSAAQSKCRQSRRVSEAADYLNTQPVLASSLRKTVGTGNYKLLDSERHDGLREVTRGYGSRPPGDYLESFRTYVASKPVRGC
jgi:hypothetical protein